MTSIYLVRHAQTIGNRQHRFTGRTDTPLSQEGLKQAHHLAQRFWALPLDAVYASPLIRARQTAEAIAVPHSLVPRIEKGIIEMDGGELEDLTYKEMYERYPDEVACFAERMHDFGGTAGCEHISTVYARMRDTIELIANRHLGGTVVAVSHGIAIRCFLCFAKAFPLERIGEVDWGNNTGVSHIAYRNGCFSLLRANDTSHLPKHLLGAGAPA